MHQMFSFFSELLKQQSKLMQRQQIQFMQQVTQMVSLIRIINSSPQDLFTPTFPDPSEAAALKDNTTYAYSSRCFGQKEIRFDK